MVIIRRAIALAFVLGLLGCHPNAMPIKTYTATPTTNSVPAPPIQENPDSTPGPNELSLLTLSIKWPKQTYRVAALPTSTNALSIEVKQGDTLLAQQVVSREDSDPLAAVNIPLKAAQDLTVNVRAYRDLHPDLPTAVPVASGTATGVTLVRSRSKSLSITLLPARIPSITSVNPTNVVPGATISINGLNLDDPTGATPSVYFGVADNMHPSSGIQATIVVPVSSTSLEVVAPDRTVNGLLAVFVDGIPSVYDQPVVVNNGLQATIKSLTTTGILAWKRLEVCVTVTNQYPAHREGLLAVMFKKAGQVVETQTLQVAMEAWETHDFVVTSTQPVDEAQVAIREIQDTQIIIE